MTLYKNKYRVESARLMGWDYSSEGAYFITVCTAERECLFGEIVNHQMILSDIGKIVHWEWKRSFVIRAELYCDGFVIMPNHIHGILRIDYGMGGDGDRGGGGGGGGGVETHGRASLQGNPNTNAIRQPKSISSFMACFKSAVTKRVNILRQTPNKPVWQSRFHDHVIRNADEFYRIKQYIIENPKRWGQDKFFNR